MHTGTEEGTTHSAKIGRDYLHLKPTNMNVHNYVYFLYKYSCMRSKQFDENVVIVFLAYRGQMKNSNVKGG